MNNMSLFRITDNDKNIEKTFNRKSYVTDGVGVNCINKLSPEKYNVKF